MIARAVASIEVLVNIAQQLLRQDGVLLMMKSDELLSKQYQARIEKLIVPDVNGSRTLVIMEKKLWQK